MDIRCNAVSKISITMDSEATEPNAINEEYYTMGKHLQRIFQPLNILQAIFLCAKYNIRNNIISPIGRIYGVISIGSAIVLMTIYYILYVPTNIWRDNINQVIFDIFEFVLYFYGVLLNALFNFIQNTNNVVLVLRLQNLHRILNINGKCYKLFIIWNWVFSLVISNFQIIWLYAYFTAFYGIGVDNMLTAYICLRFDLNVVYATRTIKLLGKSLEKWTEDIWKSAYIENSKDNQYWDSMFEAYLDTIKVFELIEKTYQQTILFYIIHTCVNGLLDIWFRVKMRATVRDSDLKYGILTFVALSWLMKNLTLQTLLSVETERFYSALRKVQSTCILITTLKQPKESEKRFYKNIQRVQESSFKRMNICSLFTVDAELPLRMLKLITTYTVVILQFQFL